MLVGVSMGLHVAAAVQVRQPCGGMQAEQREGELAAARHAAAAAEAAVAAAGERAADAQAEARPQALRLGVVLARRRV